MHDNDLIFQVIEGAKFALQNDRFPAFSIIANEYGEIISQSQNRTISEVDPTAHSEICAIREASIKSRTRDLSGLTLYTALEPCLMCLSACHFAGIKKVIYILGKEEISKKEFEGNFNNKEITMRFSNFIEIIQHVEFEEKMKTMMEIWRDKNKKYWK